MVEPFDDPLTNLVLDRGSLGAAADGLERAAIASPEQSGGDVPSDGNEAGSVGAASDIGRITPPIGRPGALAPEPATA